MFLFQSKHIAFSHMDIGYLYGMGVVSQFCSNLSFSNIRFQAMDKDRQSSSAADSLHFSSCAGKIKISDCKFSNPHDDAINVHGTYLKIESMYENKMLLRYCHPQTQGFLPFFPGDILECVDSQSLLPVGKKQTVRDAQLLDDMDKTRFEITLEETPDIAFSDRLVVDNKSHQANLYVERNDFQNIPTRAILVSSAGKIKIKNNRFSHIQMAAIYISADANEWYESGAVKDVWIEGNEFTQCQQEIVCIEPMNNLYSQEKVHSNITIQKNKIETAYLPVIAVKSSDNVRIVENEVYFLQEKKNTNNVLMNCDSQVICLENTFYEK